MMSTSNRNLLFSAAALSAMLVVISPIAAAPLAIANFSFELDPDDTSGANITGWNSDETSGAQWWVGLTDETGNPPASIPVPHGGQFLTNARQSAGVGSQPVDSAINSDPIDISADAALIASGTASLNLNFFYNNNDDRDTAELMVRFWSNNDGTGTDLGMLSTGTLSDGDLGDGDFSWIDPWQENTLSGLVPGGANSLVIEITSTRTGGSETNTAFDNFSGAIVPEPAAWVLMCLGSVVLPGARRRV